MIRATLIRRGNEVIGFTCSGHAGQAQSGHDIVCAAASILSYTCVNALESVAGIRADTVEKDGLMKARIPYANTASQVILLTWRQGFSDLAEAYPQYVKLNEITEE